MGFEPSPCEHDALLSEAEVLRMFDFNSVSVSIGGLKLEPVTDDDIRIESQQAAIFDTAFTLKGEAAEKLASLPIGTELTLTANHAGKEIVGGQRAVLAARKPQPDGSVFFGFTFVA